MPDCRNSTESGCRCPTHHPGLGAFAADPIAYQAALNQLPTRDRTSLTVITTEQVPTLELVCDGSMTCPCRSCSKNRAQAQPVEIRQPWEPRPARIAA